MSTAASSSEPLELDAAGSRASPFARLPLELVDYIVGWSVADEYLPIRLERKLSNLAITHSCFLAASQRRLFRQPNVETVKQAMTLSRLLTRKQRLAGYVRSLRVTGVHMSEPELLDELREVGRTCHQLTTLQLSHVAFQTSKHTDLIARLTRLDLSNVTLALEPTTSDFPSLVTLNCNNAAVVHNNGVVPSFPVLQRLNYCNTLPTILTFSSSPIFFSSDAVLATGKHLQHLSIGRLFSPLHHLTARKSPALIAGPLPPARPIAEPSLASYHALTSLALLADSSYQAGAYFPLLDSLPLPPRKQLSIFEVMVDLGHRDKVQEVEGVAEELIERFFPSAEQAEADAWRREGGPVQKGAGLTALLLPRVFEQLSSVAAMMELKQKAEAEGVQIVYVR